MKKTQKIVWAVLTALAFTTQTSQAQSIADGTRYLEQEQYKNARKTFQELFEKAQTAENAYHLGHFYLKIEIPDSANIYFEKGIAADAKYPLNYVGRGTVKYIKKDKSGAKADFDEALNMSKRKNAEVMHRIGEAYITYDQKDPSAAIDILNGNKTNKQKGAKDLAPQDAEIALTLGDAFLERNDMNKIVDNNNDGGNAASNYQRAIGINPKLAKAYIKKGNIMVRARNYKKALEDYKKGIEADPTYSPAYRYTGELYAKYGMYKEASQYYEDYMKRSDGSVEGQYRYAQFLFQVNEYAKALSVLKNLDGEVNTPNYWRLRFYCAYETKDFANATKDQAKFWSLAPVEKVIPSDYEYTGRLSIATGGDTLKAIENLHKVTELDSTKTGLYRELYTMFYTARKYKGAAEEMKLFISKTKRPTANDYLSLGMAHYFDKDYVPADSAFAITNRLQETALGMFYRGRSSDRLDKDTKAGLAKPHWERFIEIADAKKDIEKIAEAYYGLARIAAAKNDLVKVEEFAKKSLEASPDYAPAKNMLEKIAELKKSEKKK